MRHGSACRDKQRRFGLVRSCSGGAGFVSARWGAASYGGLGWFRSGWARHVAVRHVTETKGGGLCRSLTTLKINIRKDYGR